MGIFLLNLKAVSLKGVLSDAMLLSSVGKSVGEGGVLVGCWLGVGGVFVGCWWGVCGVLVGCWLGVGGVLVGCWWGVSWVMVGCWLDVGWVFVGCWLGVGRVRWDVNGFWIGVLVGFEEREGGRRFWGGSCCHECCLSRSGSLKYKSTKQKKTYKETQKTKKHNTKSIARY